MKEKEREEREKYRLSFLEEKKKADGLDSDQLGPSARRPQKESIFINDPALLNSYSRHVSVLPAFLIQQDLRTEVFLDCSLPPNDPAERYLF